MADLSITATSVVTSGTSGNSFLDCTAGATITAGVPCYLDSTDSDKAKPCISSSLAASAIRGVALHAATSGQPLRLQVSGNMVIGATVAKNTIYNISANAGGVTSDAIGSGAYGGIVGFGISTTVITLICRTTGVATA